MTTTSPVASEPPALTDEVPPQEPLGASPDWSDGLRWALLLGTGPAYFDVAVGPGRSHSKD